MRFTDAQPIRAVNDHNCFGCGALNPAGLHLQFYATDEPDTIWASWLPTVAFEGYGGMIHGGIICTLLDEIMTWSLYSKNLWAVTAKMQTSFRKPVVVGQPVRLIGTVTRVRGRILEVHGEIRSEADDVLLAEADATFIRVPESQADEWTERYLIESAT
ncbi:MAG: PaaI family thioesterase [Thermomicrobiales bacterium]|nr:PaaI family thioesterase [Thermomicrobiales bacterium]MCO5223972.1 PaaI family thioesterase [Thermomicrobiales bacterium]